MVYHSIVSISLILDEILISIIILERDKVETSLY